MYVTWSAEFKMYIVMEKAKHSWDTLQKERAERRTGSTWCQNTSQMKTAWSCCKNRPPGESRELRTHHTRRVLGAKRGRPAERWERGSPRLRKSSKVDYRSKPCPTKQMKLLWDNIREYFHDVPDEKYFLAHEKHSTSCKRLIHWFTLENKNVWSLKKSHL